MSALFFAQMLFCNHCLNKVQSQLYQDALKLNYITDYSIAVLEENIFRDPTIGFGSWFGKFEI